MQAVASEPIRKYDENGFALECACCGAPSNGLRRCQWCGSAIPYLKPEEKKTEIPEPPRNQTLENIARGISNAVYTISGIKI